MSHATAVETQTIVYRDVQMTFSGSGKAAAASDVTALEEINLAVPRGEFIAIVGASGCGKTTLLNMVAGLTTPTSGSVSVFGSAPSCSSRDVGYMFARDALLPWRTAARNVELPLEARGWSKRARSERSSVLLGTVGLAGRERQYPLQLSQGMRQRVALARTLAPEPDVLLMDEPFAALDARTKLTLQTEFLRLWEDMRETENSKTVIFVTHDLHEAVLLADRVIVMLPGPGRIAEDLPIGLPRPRSHMAAEVVFAEEFQKLSRALFEALEGAIAEPSPRRVGVR